MQAVLDESVEVLLDQPFLLVATRFGHVGVNAGIDQSNVGDARILLLPENPSESAETIRSKLRKDCAVIITDTCGRPFRSGVAGVAIGWAGIAALRDWRGERDMHGKALEITLEAIVDEIASAANLLMGEAGDGTPAVVFRGLKYPRSGGDSVFMERGQRRDPASPEEIGFYRLPRIARGVHRPVRIVVPFKLSDAKSRLAPALAAGRAKAFGLCHAQGCSGKRLWALVE